MSFCSIVPSWINQPFADARIFLVRSSRNYAFAQQRCCYQVQCVAPYKPILSDQSMLSCLSQNAQKPRQRTLVLEHGHQ